MATACDRYGWVSLRLHAAESTEEDVGFLVERIGGITPSELEFPSYPIQDKDGWVGFNWTDGDSEEQEPFAFLLRIQSVDRAGVVSLPLEVEVSDPGREATSEGECRAKVSVRRSPSFASALFALACGLVVLSRRRGSRRGRCSCCG